MHCGGCPYIAQSQSAEDEVVLTLVHRMLKPSGRLLLVEYDSDKGNHWVPHPMSFETWRALTDANGFAGTRKLASVPSRFLGRIYSAVSIRA
jgi:hypothetical protein